MLRYSAIESLTQSAKTIMSRSRSRDRELRGGDNTEEAIVRADRSNNKDSAQDRSSGGSNSGSSSTGDAAGGPIFNLHISNLSTQTSEKSLRDAFSVHGDIKEASIVTDPKTLERRGFGFVCFHTLEDADRAMAAMNDVDLDGRRIKVQRARRNAGHPKVKAWAGG